MCNSPPPSAVITAPVMYRARSLHKNITASATSFGSAIRPNGTPASTRAFAPGAASSTASNEGVSIPPGATALTLMPAAPFSFAATRVERFDARLARGVHARPDLPAEV